MKESTIHFYVMYNSLKCRLFYNLVSPGRKADARIIFSVIYHTMNPKFPESNPYETLRSSSKTSCSLSGIEDK